MWFIFAIVLFLFACSGKASNSDTLMITSGLFAIATSLSSISDKLKTKTIKKED